MISIGKLGAGRGEYYLAQVAGGVEDYYMGPGEAPGQWMGSGLDGLGLGSEVDAEDLRAVLTGVAPSGEPWVERTGRRLGSTCASRHRSRCRETLYDFIFGLEYLEPHYALTFNDKQIAQLSPGERGAALLIFYLLVDKSDLPILLDQPEENLDNATVSRLLVPAIRKARDRRQVILVTHNPNLAVYCDADQVIYCDIVRAPSTRITYQAGPLESLQTRRWVIDVLEGTGKAFGKRHDIYRIGPHGELVLKGE